MLKAIWDIMEGWKAFGAMGYSLASLFLYSLLAGLSYRAELIRFGHILRADPISA